MFDQTPSFLREIRDGRITADHPAEVAASA
jgi:hypothetical protein